MTQPRLRSATLAAAARVLALVAPLLVAACSSGADADANTPPRFEASERFPGGDTTNTLLLGSNAFTRAADNISDEHAALFYSGNASFNQNWVQAPASTQQRDGLGPMFNARSCSSCHFKDGRGSPPRAEDEGFVGLLLRLSIPGVGEHGEPLPEPNYGGQLQQLAIPNVTAEGTPQVRYETVHGSYADGEPYELISPVYTVTNLAHGPMHADAELSPRVAPAMAGLGLLQAIPLERLRELEDADDADGDGISGRINWVWDVVREQSAVGRFGWKAEQPSVRQQTAAALSGDLGITSSLFSDADCTSLEGDCAAAPNGGAPEISDEALDRLDVYGQLLAVPVRERWSDRALARGKALFTDSGCARCHVPSHVTAASTALSELAEQTIWPYTDLLLHDLGEALSDDRPSFAAAGNEWRTPPLWGLRLYRIVNGHDRLLHDGRARGVAEAILWHGGEAEAARQVFLTLSRDERDLLVEFVESFVKRRAWLFGTFGLTVAALGRALTGCGPTEIQDQRRELLRSWGEAFLLQAYADFEARCLELEAKAGALRDDPSETTLADAQAAWSSARVPWKQTEVFAFGPYSEEPLRLGPKIDFWPARPASVQEALQAEDPLDLDRLGAPAKGLHALEFLLFEADVVLVDAFSANPRRGDYALSLASDLVARARELFRAWSPAHQNFLGELLNAGQSSQLYDTLNQALAEMVNRMGYTLENMSAEKLAKPLGDSAGGVPQPDQLESPFSRRSLEDLRDNLRGLELLYFGDAERGVRSLDAYLVLRGRRLAPAFSERLDACYAALDSIAAPLEEAVSSDPASVRALMARLGELRRLIQVDVINALSLSVGFNDNDGD